MQRRIRRRHRLPGDAELFAIIRTYIKEVLGPRLDTVLPIHVIDTVFDDYKLTQLRVASQKHFAGWVTKAYEHHHKKDSQDERIFDDSQTHSERGGSE